MKYIGPFLRINKLKKENIEHQLFHFSKESLKHILLYSRCGIYTTYKDLSLKNIPNIDINTFKGVSPLLCVYKKGSPQIVNTGKSAYWEEDKLKKEVLVKNNAFFTLSLLELTDYYVQFKDKDPQKYSYYTLYSLMAKKQLEFYASYLRNVEGVFVDKVDISDETADDLKFEDKSKKFKYSSQALVMAAFYKASTLIEELDSQCYVNFSLDILNMLIQFKEELYLLSYDELLYTCLGLAIFYKYSKNKECLSLMLDLCELLNEKYTEDNFSAFSDELEMHLLTASLYKLLYLNTDLIKYKELYIGIESKVIDLYSMEEGVFLKNKETKENVFSSLEITLSLLALLSYCEYSEEQKEVEHVLAEAFKRHFVDSGIVLSWPEVPSLDDKERYRNFSLKNEDLLDESFFKLPSIPSPENSEVAPIMLKEITYNRKKQCFKQGRSYFDSSQNLECLFMCILFLNKKFTF